MCTFKNWVIECSSDFAKSFFGMLSGLEINGAAIDINEEVRFSGEVSDSGGEYLDGQKIQTSPIVSIRRDGKDSFVAITSRGREYRLSLLRKFNAPTLNLWWFVEETDSIYADFSICRHEPFNLKEPIAIQGETSEVPGFVDGTVLRVEKVISIAPAADYSSALVVETKEGSKFLLPLEQRIGFINTHCIVDWHLTFDYPPSDENGWSDLRMFLERFRDFTYKTERLPPDMFSKEYLPVPEEYGIGIESNKYSTDGIVSFMKICYLGIIKLYAVVDEQNGLVLEYDSYSTDKIQKKLMQSIEGDKNPKGIRRLKRRMEPAALKI